MRRCLPPICALCLGAVPAAAGPLWAAVTGGPATFVQDDVGALVWSVNEAAEPLAMDDPDAGQAWGAALALGLGDRLSAGLGYERFSAESELKGGEAAARFALPAHALRAFVEYRVEPRPWLAVGAGLGAGVVIADGEQRVDPALLALPAGDYEGEGLLIEGYWLGSLLLDDALSLDLALGYRHAAIDDVRVGDERLRNADDSYLGLDYGGLLLRFGLRLRLR